jgi:hypothetical protein
MEKLCIFCEHFDWGNVNYHYYSEETGGTIEGGATCKKQHFWEVLPDSTEDFRKLILRAYSCKDYTPPLTTNGDK